MPPAQKRSKAKIPPKTKTKAAAAKGNKNAKGQKAETGFSLNDQLFNHKTVAKLTSNLQAAHPAFDSASFTKTVLSQFPTLELKQRIHAMADALRDHLPDDLSQTFDILEKSLPEPLDPTRSDDDFGEFIWAVPNQFVATYGCSSDHLDRSLAFLRESTKRFSAEFAIRPFLNEHPDAALDFVRDNVTDSNYHVRRLSSEGIRPFLPWAERVNLQPPDVVNVLDSLHTDSTRYVTRSVANNLNDLSKIEPILVIETLKRWHTQGKQSPEELAWMTRHALRSLVKADNADALALLGYPTTPKFALSKLAISESVTIGQHLEWQGQLQSKAPQKLKLSLRIHFLKANGRHSTKDFSLKDVELAQGERLDLSKRVAFKPMTTRTLYEGEHWVELVVNGVVRGKRAFDLTLIDRT